MQDDDAHRIARKPKATSNAKSRRDADAMTAMAAWSQDKQRCDLDCGLGHCPSIRHRRISG
jgi:hypothetical protein